LFSSFQKPYSLILKDNQQCVKKVGKAIFEIKTEKGSEKDDELFLGPATTTTTTTTKLNRFFSLKLQKNS